MSKNKKASLPQWLSNRNLISVEAILLVGLLESIAENYISSQPWPKPIITLVIMLMIAGVLGGLMSVVMLLTKKSLMKGQKVFNLRPASFHSLILHLLILSGIFWLYHTSY